MLLAFGLTRVLRSLLMGVSPNVRWDGGGVVSGGDRVRGAGTESDEGGSIGGVEVRVKDGKAKLEKCEIREERCLAALGMTVAG